MTKIEELRNRSGHAREREREKGGGAEAGRRTRKRRKRAFGRSRTTSTISTWECGKVDCRGVETFVSVVEAGQVMLPHDKGVGVEESSTERETE